MKTELDFRIERRFEDGLAATLDWCLEHDDWLERRAQTLPAWLRKS